MARPQRVPLGPFTGGLVEASAPTAPNASYLAGTNLSLRATGAITFRRGTAITSVLRDDQGSPAPVSAVVWLGTFKDGGAAIAWSSVTSKVYLYITNSEMTAAYGASAGAGFTTYIAPTAVIWTGITVKPFVTAVEGLGYLYIAHALGTVAGGPNIESRYWNGSAIADISGAAALLSGGKMYFNGLIAFQNHLWGWGYGASADPFRPEMARYSGISFGSGATDLFAASDSLTLGDRVKTVREAIITAGVAGDSLILAGASVLSRVIGYDRDTWQRQILDRSFGAAGHRCGVSVGEYWYWWSSQGPCRVAPNGAIEPLFIAIENTSRDIANPTQVTAIYDRETEEVHFLSQRSASTSTPSVLASYDHRNGRWINNNGLMGIVVGCGAIVPVVSSAFSALPGPVAAPSALASSGASLTSIALSWTAPDAFSDIWVEYRVNGSAPWTRQVLPPLSATLALTSLALGTTYEWRVGANRNGQTSYSHASGFPTFATVGTITAPTAPVINANITYPSGASASWTITEYLANSRVQFALAGGSSTVPSSGDAAWGNDIVTPAFVASATILIAGSQVGFAAMRVRHEYAGVVSAWATVALAVNLIGYDPPGEGGGGGTGGGGRGPLY